MTIAEWLVPAMVRLREAGVDSPRRDCLVLLEDTIKKDRAWVVAHPEHQLDKKVAQHLDALITRRSNREPLAYIRGKTWFYGRFFTVNKNVLIPRPESETFIDLLKGLKASDKRLSTIIDLGTGSGALAITAKLELSEGRVIATDTSKKALAIAQKNSAKHQVDIEFLLGNLFEPLGDEHLENSIVIANLPYVPDNLITSPEITQEPPEALFSGKDGLDHYQSFWQQINARTIRPTYILTESLEPQHKTLEQIAKQSGYIMEKVDVLIQQFRKI